jgi:hypothetical protein
MNLATVSTMSSDKPALTADNLILEKWERLDCESVGATELHQIQIEIEKQLGPAAVTSPASIARLLADHGATLRHPEILEFDSEWRDKHLSTFSAMDFSSLSGAVVAFRQLESLRKQCRDKNELSRLFEFVSDVRDELSLAARDNKTNAEQAEAKEISEWLSLWRSSPDLFAGWLELRLDSPGFHSLFPDFRVPEVS